MSRAQSESIALSPARILRLLSEGTIEVEGLIPWSSNATLLATVSADELSSLAVYKPQRGERPLWDFPQGTLGKREVAAYQLSEALGWGLVPPTVLRLGPYGLGSMQFFIHAKDEAHYFTIQDDGAYTGVLQQLAAFDIIANNADRKSGHCLLDHTGQLWAIDNALCFHVEPKLRTVIWDFALQPLPTQLLDDLQALQGRLVEGSDLSHSLSAILSEAEVSALRWRLQRLVHAGRYPEPGTRRAVPWPLV